jgi:fructokinase
MQAFAPSQKVDVLDTTGAGDGFTGSFLWKLRSLGITQENLSKITQEKASECLVFSNRFCGISVTKPGAIDSYPDRAMMEN